MQSLILLVGLGVSILGATRGFLILWQGTKAATSFLDSSLIAPHACRSTYRSIQKTYTPFSTDPVVCPFVRTDYGYADSQTPPDSVCLFLKSSPFLFERGYTCKFN